MKDEQEIINLSKEIWSSCINRPNRQEIRHLDSRLEKIDISDLIVYNFFNHHGTALRDFLLATFQFWKFLNYNDWMLIFDRIRGFELGEYYMGIFCSTYLGINPKFKSIKDVEVFHATTEDNRVQSGKPSIFISKMEGRLRELEEEELLESFGITVDEVLSITKALRLEQPEAKGFLKKLFK